MFSVKFGASQTNTMGDMDAASQDPSQNMGYQMDPTCRKYLPENEMADGGQYTMGATSQQEVHGQVQRPDTGTFSEEQHPNMYL